MKLSIRDLDLACRRVLIRVDFNVPMKEGRVTDDWRIRAALPTIRYALERHATVVLASHLGRPNGRVDRQYSLAPVVSCVSALLGQRVHFAEDCIGETAKRAVERAHTAESKVVLLENLRFHPGEEADDPAFARELASLADRYVNDAFGAVHRAHASVHRITQYIPDAAAGLLVERELGCLGRLLKVPDRPFVVILGGAKIADKLPVIESLLDRIDRLAVGGAVASTFLKARGVSVDRSPIGEDVLEAVRTIDAKAATRRLEIVLPVDHLVASHLGDDTPIAFDVGDRAIGERLALDVGPKTIARFAAAIADARTVFWNGPVGKFEIPAFAVGTIAVARAVADVRGLSIACGGETIAAVRQAGVADRVTHLSTGGGASLAFLAGRTLPGVEALAEKPATEPKTMERPQPQPK